MSCTAKDWRRQWHPTPVLLPGKSHGWRSLVGCGPWGRWSRTWLSNFIFTFHFHFSLSCIGEGNGNPLQCSCLENPRDGEAWWAAVHRVGHDWSDLAAAAALQKMSLGLCIACVMFHQVSFLTSTLWKVMGKLFCRVPQFGFSDLHDSFQAIPFKKNFTLSNAMFSNVSYQVTQNF